MKELWVCWISPRQAPGDAAVLSFLPPGDEAALEGSCRLIRAREASRSVREGARAAYLKMAARIGTASCGGRTLRESLCEPGKVSRWWYHSISFKDCEGDDPAFDWWIAVDTIRAEADRTGAESLVLWGAPVEIEAVLRPIFRVHAYGPRGFRYCWRTWLRGLASRARTAWTILRQASAARAYARTPSSSLDVAFAGFWDWSFWPDDAGRLADRYYKRLPAELERLGVRSTGWFAWLDPHYGRIGAKRSLDSVLAPLGLRSDVILLQSYLTLADVLCAAADLRPLRTYLWWRDSTEFRKVFYDRGADFFPFFSERLLRGFLDGGMVRFELAALAAERAARVFKPKTTVNFLEHFHFARAYNEGIRRGYPAATRTAIQHAGFCREKTFYFFDPEIEFQGSPDGCAVPHPDVVYAMGRLGRELFLSCGYSEDRVLLTGSTRYDDAPEPGESTAFPQKGSLRLLLAASVDTDSEAEMAEAAVLAARDLGGVRIYFRNYPFTRIENHPRFQSLRDKMRITRETLEEDLEHADAVLFTSSTVAEEAFLRGKPAWQWLPLGFNASALAEAADIPQFASVGELRQAMADFLADPVRSVPSLDRRRAVCERLFYRSDGLAARRIAESLRGLMGRSSQNAEALVP